MRQRLLGAAVCWLALVAAAAADDQSMLRAREAGAAMARANVDQAISLYTQALADKTLPNDRRAVILSDRCVAHARRQSPKDAIEDFNRALFAAWPADEHRIVRFPLSLRVGRI